MLFTGYWQVCLDRLDNQAGVELAVKLIEEIKPWAQGIYLMPQLNRYDMVAEIVEAVR